MADDSGWYGNIRRKLTLSQTDLIRMSESLSNDKYSANAGGSGINRRHFFSKAIGILSFFGTLLISIPFIGSLYNSGHEKKKKQFIKIVNLDLLPVNDPQKVTFSEPVSDAYIFEIENRDVWIIKHSDSSVTVFSPVCPHLGCSYNWNSEDKLFVCPCHSSIFSPDGKVVAGPSPRGLDHLPQKIVGGELYIEWERFEIGIPEVKTI
jgi:quinol---cytochrome c reductase iron-sulfur subunit, bacillus type